ncbi:MAG TPA: alpha-amylase family protein [Rhizomicrobium sp.]|nr:alpha-amylase family protein [Rhizomicrobium sp.]
MRRRDFTLAAGAALATAALGPDGAAAAAEKSDAAAPRTHFDPQAWHQRLKRIMQVNFNEKDAENFDVEAWADYLASVKAQATFLSVTNIVAFYPTRLPDLPVSPFLRGRDLFGECARAAHKRNVRVMGRLSIETAHASLSQRHPDWFRRTADGKIATRSRFEGDPSTSPEFAQTCQFTGYYSDFVPALIQEVITRYDIDGIYSNGWPGTNVPKCYCAACRRIGDPDSAAYKAAYLRRAKELWGLYDSIVARHNPEMIFSGNLGGGFRGGDIDLKELTQYAAWFIADNQGRGGIGAPAWDAAQQTRIAKAIMGDRPVPNSTGAYEISGNGVWRNVTGNAHEVKLRLFQTTAAGGVLYYHWLGFYQGFLEDRRWQKVGQDVLPWQAKHDKHFHNIRSIASVALVVAQRSNRLYKAPPGTNGLDAVNGMYQILTEARIPFDVVLDTDLDAARLARYSMLVLPNVAWMSDLEARQITDFAARGGSVLATFETGVYDENGKARSDFALADVFGIRMTSARQGYGRNAGPSSGEGGFGDGATPGQPSVQRIERSHPLVDSFRDTHYIQGASWRVPITTDGAPILTHIAQYPTAPTETVYSRQWHTGIPTVAARQAGKSRLVYLAEDIEASYFRTSAGDLGDLVTNALNWLVADDRPLTVEGSGLVESYGWVTEPGYAVHLINYTNPNFRAGGSRDVYPVGAQRVRLILADDRPIRQARLLRSDQPLAVTQSGRAVEFTVPMLEDYEVATLEV